MRNRLRLRVTGVAQAARGVQGEGASRSEYVVFARCSSLHALTSADPHRATRTEARKATQACSIAARLRGEAPDQVTASCDAEPAPRQGLLHVARADISTWYGHYTLAGAGRRTGCVGAGFTREAFNATGKRFAGRSRASTAG